MLIARVFLAWLLDVYNVATPRVAIPCVAIPCVAILRVAIPRFHAWHTVNYTRRVFSMPRENVVHANT